MEILPLIIAAPLLLLMGYGDLRYMRIPNRLVLALVTVFVASALFLPIDSVAARLFAAACLFVIGFVAFAVGIFGGGDTKALAALMLLVPPGNLSLFALVLSAALLAGIGLVLLLRMAPRVRRSSWVGLRARGMFPMGLSMAMAGLAYPPLIVSFHT